jgi:hypothetical protein
MMTGYSENGVDREPTAEESALMWRVRRAMTLTGLNIALKYSLIERAIGGHPHWLTEPDYPVDPRRAPGADCRGHPPARYSAPRELLSSTALPLPPGLVGVHRLKRRKRRLFHQPHDVDRPHRDLALAELDCR